MQEKSVTAKAIWQKIPPNPSWKELLFLIILRLPFSPPRSWVLHLGEKAVHIGQESFHWHPRSEWISIQIKLQNRLCPQAEEALPQFLLTACSSQQEVREVLACLSPTGRGQLQMQWDWSMLVLGVVRTILEVSRSLCWISGARVEPETNRRFSRFEVEALITYEPWLLK